LIGTKLSARLALDLTKFLTDTSNHLTGEGLILFGVDLRDPNLGDFFG